MKLRYLPQTEQEIQKMCETIGVASPADLFGVFLRSALQRLLDLPPPLAEFELLQSLSALAQKNATVLDYTSFLGAGAYAHYIPSVVDSIISRGEFMTSYTPYQPELSQGTLQSIFEFQTMVASLLGFDLANASTYDGSTSFQLKPSDGAAS